MLRQKGLVQFPPAIAVLVIIFLIFIGWKYTQTSVPSSKPAPTDKVKIFLVSLEDEGKQGKKIGCNDSLVPQEVEILDTQDKVAAALEALLEFKDNNYQKGGLYSGLAYANLEVDDVIISNSQAKVLLSGSLNLGGECDDPRVEEQLKATVLQFPYIKETEIFLNDKPLHEVLSGKGGE